MPPRIEIAPSILSADFRCLESQVKDVEQAGADRIHCDVMDGRFVPNITFGPLVIEAVKKCVSIPLDVHLMIEEPERYVDAFCSAGADTLTVHAEAISDLPAVIESIRSQGARVGICVNPDKEIALFEPYLESIDQVLIMTVFAGFGGQEFISDMLPKLRSVHEMAQKRHPELDIQVDGGINHATAEACAKNGANVFVAGSYVFKGSSYRERIEAIREQAQRGLKE